MNDFTVENHGSIFLLQPQGELMADTPLAFRVHALSGLALFLVWPFTRLVHAFTAPLHYLFRPYIVYRSRDVGARPGSVPQHRGWAPVGTRDRDRQPTGRRGER